MNNKMICDRWKKFCFLTPDRYGKAVGVREEQDCSTRTSELRAEPLLSRTMFLLMFQVELARVTRTCRGTQKSILSTHDRHEAHS